MLVGREGGRAVLIWPLVTYHRFGTCLAHALDSETTEYRGIIAESGPERADRVSQAWDFLTRQSSIDAFYFQYVPQGSALDTIARQAGGMVSDQEELQYLDCRTFADWSGFVHSWPQKRRSDLRRRRRRLEEKAKVEIVRLSNAQQLSIFLPWFFETKTAALSTASGSTEWFTTPEHREFLTAMLHDGFQSGFVVAMGLMADGKYIAGKIDVEFGETKSLLVTTFDRAWSRYGPGTILYGESVREGFEKGFAVIDFRLGQELHKVLWTNRTAITQDYWVPCTQKGKRYVAWRLSGVRDFLKRVRQRMGG